MIWVPIIYNVKIRSKLHDDGPDCQTFSISGFIAIVNGTIHYKESLIVGILPIIFYLIRFSVDSYLTDLIRRWTPQAP